MRKLEKDGGENGSKRKRERNWVSERVAVRGKDRAIAKKNRKEGGRIERKGGCEWSSQCTRVCADMSFYVM